MKLRPTDFSKKDATVSVYDMLHLQEDILRAPLKPTAVRQLLSFPS